MRGDFFALLEDQLRGAAAGGEPRRSNARTARHARRVALLLAALLLAAGAAVAGSRLLPIGTEVPVAAPKGAAEPERYGPRVVVAAGRVPVYGRWQLFASRSSVGPCQAIQFLDDTAAGAGVAEGCGAARPVTASAVLPVPGGPKPQETVVYGRVPDETAHVRVTVPGLGTTTTDAVDGPAAIAGNWYLVAISGIPHAGTARVVALDRNGRRLGATTRMPISLHPVKPNPVARLVGAPRFVVTRRGHALVPLACPRVAGHAGKCIGTVVIRLRNHLPQCGRRPTGRRARCGWRYYGLGPGTKRRVIRVSVGPGVLPEARRTGAVDARLRIAGKSVDAKLVPR